MLKIKRKHILLVALFSNLFEFDQWQQLNEAPSERRCLCSDLLKHGLLSFMRTEQ